jgi:hypothetical protein
MNDACKILVGVHIRRHLEAVKAHRLESNIEVEIEY